MKQENNGKIAIAIVAMFVVALSVVGFTYAYFTARVEDNDAEKSVEVKAGKLSIVYTGTNNINAQNIVPGWVSDGKHYYDPVYSVQEVAGEHHISAVSTDEQGHATKSGCTPSAENTCVPTAADGITNMVTFNVTNDSDNTAANNYVIQLTNIVNGLGNVGETESTVSDTKYLWVTLYSTNQAGTTDTVIWSGNLAASGNQIIVPGVRTIAAGNNTDYYKIKLTYQNVTDATQNSINKSVSATVSVVGVNQNQSSQWVTETGTVIEFPDANANDVSATATLS